jgi:glycolate oxidase FAD binding subunit
MTPMPDTADQVQQCVREAQRLRVRGGGTKSPTDGDGVLDLTRLTGIVEYAPEECVFTARAGTPLRDVVATLGEHQQYLPFDPPFAAAGATLGGTVAAGISGPRRYRYGGVRDFLIGVRIVDGEGRLIRSGGKVVKNAAGFLLHHAMVGSGGRFGVLTELTFKVFPAPESRRTATMECGSVEAAFLTAQRIEALRIDCEAIDFDERGHLVVTLAGREAAMAPRLARLELGLGDRAVRHAGGGPEAAKGVPIQGGQSPPAGTVPPTLVKVAGIWDRWRNLQPHVTSAQFMCAGAVAWLTTADLDALARALADAGLVGQVIRGARAGARIGHVVVNEFEERVRRVLDPQNRFSAAPHPRA